MQTCMCAGESVMLCVCVYSGVTGEILAQFMCKLLSVSLETRLGTAL